MNNKAHRILLSTLQGLIILAIGAGAIWLTSFIPSSKDNEVIPVGCPSDKSIVDQISKRVDLISNEPSNGLNGVLKGYTVTLKRSGLTSNIACGYLIYELSYNNNPVEDEYMNLYMNPTGGQFGGHVLPSEIDGAIIEDLEDRTRVIIPLNKITYDGRQRFPIKKVDWASLLNITDEIKFDIALNAAVSTGELNLVQVAYRCINKETALETDECLLEKTEEESFKY